MYGKVLETLQTYKSTLDRRRDDDDSSSVCSERTSAVREMIMRFERGLPLNAEDEEDSQDAESSDGGRTPNFINPITNQLSPLFLNTPNNRTSLASVNSILSGVSETSFASGSSGVGSDRRSDSEYRARLTPIRPAPPPPPEQFADTDSCVSRSPLPDDDDLDKRFSFTPISSPVVLRRSRQPPVMRRKSLAESHKDLGVHWSYGVTQGDLEKLLRIRRRSTNPECEGEEVRNESQHSDSSSENETQDEPVSGPRDETESIVGQEEDGCTDAASTDRSTDTLIDDGADDSDSVTVASDLSDRHSNVDNISIRSVSSLDLIPYQKYDSITVSSDEFGSEELRHAPDNEFLSVSAVNEWCVSRAAGPGAAPVESKREKYRRRLIERVNELIHTEALYVEKLRHVVEDYMPELDRTDAPAALRGSRFDIFANMDRLHRFHSEQLLPDLRAVEHDLKKLGQCFRKYEQKFNMYVIYSRNNKRANRLVYEHKNFFQEKQMTLGDRLDLSSYILEPVQRIPRYKLFLDDLVKTYQNYENESGESDSLRSKVSEDSGESDSEETALQSLKLAKQMIETLLVTVDDIIALENIRDCPINLLHQGKLLRQHEFVVTDPSRRRHNMRVFLFEKTVLLTVVYKKQLTVEIFLYRDHIPVDELGITPKEHDLLKFTVWYRKRNIKNYKLETTEPAVRAAWVQEITALLWKQAMTTKELVMQSRSARNSVISVNSQQSSDGDPEPAPPGDKYNSLRGVPGEVRRARKNKNATNRSTTWYFE